MLLVAIKRCENWPINFLESDLERINVLNIDPNEN